MPQTELVRIKTKKAKRLREIANFIPGGSISALVDRAIDKWLEDEAPVYLEAFQKVNETLKRQPVAMELVARD